MSIENTLNKELKRSRTNTRFVQHFEQKQFPKDVELALKILYFHDASWISYIGKDDSFKRSRSNGLRRTISNVINDLPEIFDKKDVTTTNVHSAIYDICRQSRRFGSLHLATINQVIQERNFEE